jgi:hypothetical protein
MESKDPNHSTSKKQDQQSGKQRIESLHFSEKGPTKWKEKTQIIPLLRKRANEVESKGLAQYY